jgi:hypothetical protein
MNSDLTQFLNEPPKTNSYLQANPNIKQGTYNQQRQREYQPSEEIEDIMVMPRETLSTMNEAATSKKERELKFNESIYSTEPENNQGI